MGEPDRLRAHRGRLAEVHPKRIRRGELKVWQAQNAGVPDGVVMRVSSRTQPNQSCVAAGVTPETTFVQDTKDPTYQTLTFSSRSFRAFLDQLR
ncbi:DUF397 domain-containing protein [Saccharothrix sp. HUAS TT1]|uniref:DUF397 domain-containing protein n=2 Tax=unclassified Saccharothrix TaxID=2593673 RepID=UPI00345C18EE